MLTRALESGATYGNSMIDSREVATFELISATHLAHTLRTSPRQLDDSELETEPRHTYSLLLVLSATHCTITNMRTHALRAQAALYLIPPIGTHLTHIPIRQPPHGIGARIRIRWPAPSSAIRRRLPFGGAAHRGGAAAAAVGGGIALPYLRYGARRLRAVEVYCGLPRLPLHPPMPPGCGGCWLRKLPARQPQDCCGDQSSRPGVGRRAAGYADRHSSPAGASRAAAA